MASSRYSILVVTADESLARSVAKLLNEYGYSTTVARDGPGGVAAACLAPTSLILVDGPPAIFQAFCQEPKLRKVPLIALHPQGTDCQTECVEELEKGADVSLCKPVSSRELVARIRAILRREMLRLETTTLFTVGKLQVDTSQHEVTLDGKPVSLTLKEFQILHQLIQRPNRVFSRDELLNLVWGEKIALEEHNLDVHVHSLRRKIENNPTQPRFIVTVRGVGYKLKSES